MKFYGKTLTRYTLCSSACHNNPGHKMRDIFWNFLPFLHISFLICFYWQLVVPTAWFCLNLGYFCTTIPSQESSLVYVSVTETMPVIAEFIRRSPLLEELLLVKPNSRGEPCFHEHERPSQTFIKAFTTFLVFISVFMEHFFCFKGLKDVPLYLVLHWLTSVSYVGVFYLLARNLSSFM